MRPLVGPATVAVVFLLVGFVAAYRFGLGPAIATAVASATVLDFFFIRPYHTLAVAEVTGAAALVVFLIVSVATSRLTVRVRRQSEAAHARARQAEALYEVARATDADVEVEPALRHVVEIAERQFGLAGCRVALGAAPTPHSAPAGRWAAFPMRATGGEVGTLWVPDDPRNPRSPGDETLLQAFADAAGLALERLRLRADASRAAALEQADALKTVLLSSVSHDLRTPLAAIKAAASGLLAPGVSLSPEARRDLVQTIDRQVDRLARLVSNLLDLSRIESGALKPAVAAADVDDVIYRSIDRLGDVLAGFRVEVAVPDDLPPGRFDETHVEEALANLLENAARYAPPGTRIGIEARADGDAIVVRVADEGPGVRVEDAARIFDPFARGAGGTDHAGTGLGLAIAQGLLAANGGRLWIENPGRPHAVFAFTVPAAREAARA